MTFNIQDHLASLNILKEESAQYVCECPICGGSNLKINKKSSAYKCWSGDCESKAIRDAVAPWDDSQSKTEIFVKVRPKAAPIFHQYPTQDGKPLIQVKREYTGEIVNGKPKKNMPQAWWDGAKWQWGSMPDEVKQQVRLYRIHDDINQKAINNGSPLLTVEGESKTDKLLSLGIAATCSIGGAGKWQQYGGVTGNYKADLASATDLKLVICPDRDQPGLKHAEMIAADFPRAAWLYANPTDPAWNNPSDSYDVGDWIAELEAQGIDKYEISNLIVDAIGEKRQIDFNVEKLNRGNSHVERSKPSRSNGRGSSVEMLNVEAGSSIKISDDTKERFAELVAIKEEQLDLAEVFHPLIAKALTEKAESLPVAPEFLMQPFLSITAGLIGTSAQIQLKKGFKLPCVLWTGLIGDPGSMKTPSINVIKEPLDFLQGLASDSYEDRRIAWEEQKRQYELLSKEEKKVTQVNQEQPHMRHYFLEDFTMEALTEVHSQELNQTGFSVIVDELSGLFSGLDQYKAGGKGNGRQKILSLKSGASTKVTTKSKQVYIKRCAVSITGGIQPKILAKLMEDPDDPDGMWGRFLWSAPPFVKPYWSDKEVDIFDFLLSMYRRLDSWQETIYTLTSEARQQYVEFNNWIADNLLLYSGAARNFLSKLKGDVASIALVLHILDSTFDSTLSDRIPKNTVERAISLGFYYFRQIIAIYEENEPSAELPQNLIRIVGLSKQIGKVTTRILCQKKWADNSVKAAQLLNQLAEFNLGTLSRSVKGLPEWEVFKKPFIKHIQHSTLEKLEAKTHTQHGLDDVENEETLEADSFNNTDSFNIDTQHETNSDDEEGIY